MNTSTTLLLTLFASCTAISFTHAQGLLGQRYFEVNAGYERFQKDSVDGQGVGATFNLPLLRGRAGLGWTRIPGSITCGPGTRG